jgi:aryl-alcohol dehydrogenase-like predicted oxidoreductase
MDLSLVVNGLAGLLNEGLAQSERGGGLSRRGFLRVAITGGAAATVAPAAARGAEAAKKGDIPYRELGRTGVKVSAIGMGGFHIGSPSESEGIRLIRTGIDSGINFMDNCWDYHDGGSEARMGKALRDGYREKVFLMTKIDGRTKELAAKQIDESLRRLQTDHVDLMQVHEVIRMNDPDRVFAEGGAIEALKEGQKAGKIRFIGFTGHKDPSIHLHMLETAKAHNFRFDTVQMPLNVMDAHFRSFEKQVVPVLVKEQIGVLGMKPLGSGVILKSNTVTPIECLHYAMNLPTSVVITGIDKMEYLNQALEAARTFKPMNEQQVASVLSKTAESASAGKFELFKTGTGFDATSSHPAWLG